MIYFNVKNYGAVADGIGQIIVRIGFRNGIAAGDGFFGQRLPGCAFAAHRAIRSGVSAIGGENHSVCERCYKVAVSDAGMVCRTDRRHGAYQQKGCQYKGCQELFHNFLPPKNFSFIISRV